MGRLVVVTGGGTGIGKAIAQRFAACGDSVIITGRRRDALDQAAAELPGDITVSCFDATDLDSVEAFAASLDSIDVLVNNAGGNRDFDAGTSDQSLRTVADTWLSNFTANVLSAVVMTTACLDKFSDGGSVVTIGSIAADQGSGSYGAAKAAVASWNVDLSRQLGSCGVTANVVSPGYIADTEFFRDKLSGQRRAELIAATATGRAGTPGDIADTVAFLASPGARHITGQVIAVNGGARTTR
ncbi:SDR family oxidoreductase [Mycobacterium sp. DL99]|uniref:SDR family NAD(P)-dependent oxidoreductase n=1 Tax=Mycobacterium sp. DL99 TaxID=2528957 RepID=UPI0010811884|nr:SDR family oxidoreductase [Mycobacterium sp. DL99]